MLISATGVPKTKNFGSPAVRRLRTAIFGFLFPTCWSVLRCGGCGESSRCKC
ncbi:MAG: hypothetical protein D4R98_06220 [Comamonadaceae bacterium]|nr:MAG: hypothetical protein D4R98_06220 [Comamonadaceae bacterium]